MDCDLSSTVLAQTALGMLSDPDSVSCGSVSAPEKHRRVFGLPSGISWDGHGQGRVSWEIMGRVWDPCLKFRITGP